jgi:hypothetical protein
MGYLNPLFKLPAGRALLALPEEHRSPLERLMRELREQANDEAENAWRRRKGPMAAYWRAVSTYARHIAHALSRGVARAVGDATVHWPLKTMRTAPRPKGDEFVQLLVLDEWLELGAPVRAWKLVYWLDAFDGRSAGWYGNNCGDLRQPAGWLMVMPTAQACCA